LLRVGRNRPRHGRTAEQPGELAPPHGAPAETSERADVITLGRRLLCITVGLAANVSVGTRLCENSDAELSRRISISISSAWKPIALAGAAGRGQLRKQSSNAPSIMASLRAA
jgi:hypothetical protein